VSKNPNQLHEREILLRDSFTHAELATYIMILTAVGASIILADPRSFWILGFYLILAPLSVANIKFHEIVHPFKIENLWIRYSLLIIPAILISLHYIVGTIFPANETFELNDKLYYILNERSKWLPSSIQQTKLTTTITFFAFISIFLVSLNLFIIPKSRYFFNRLLSKLCLLAVLAALFGYFQKLLGLTKVTFSYGTGQNDFFAFFPYDGHWAAFACLWCGACIALAMQAIHNDRNQDFSQTSGPWYLAGAVILGGTGLIVQANGPGAILLIVLSGLLLATAVQFIRANIHQNINSITLICTLTSCVLFAAGIFRLFGNPALAEKIALPRQTAFELFLERPFFGWGFESFTHVAPFFNKDTLGNQVHLSANSDALQLLSEFGLFGCLIIAALIIILTLRYLLKRKESPLCNHLLVACVGVLVMALIDSPFMSPLVTLSFGVLFMSALRYADIEHFETDQVDIKTPQLIAPQKDRRIPFFTEEQNEREI
jgi:hypothetical protein